MVAIRHILCPVDFSDGSRRALEHAGALARAWDARLTVLHVYLPLPGSEFAPLLEESVIAEPDASAIHAVLNEFIKPAATGIAVTSKLVHAADARRAIAKEADTLDCDLVVIGTHGRSGIERFALGSTTDAIVRKVRCPVLAVPSCAPPSRDGRFRRIVCGIDFSAPSLHAFRYALHLAAMEDAELTLLHAIEMPPELRDRQIAAAFDVEAVRAAAEGAARHRLESLSPGDEVLRVRITTSVVEGRAHRAIVDAAREQSADLVVLGTHGRSALDRWVFGSNAHAVLRDPPCPVLTVRPA